MLRLLVFIPCFLFASYANACSQLARESLPVFWGKFRQVSLRGNVEDISHYYTFPLRLKGPFDDDKDVVLSKRKFFENYDVIFRQGVVDQAFLLKTLREKPSAYWQEWMKHAISPGYQCTARIDDYELKWTDGTGWKIMDLYYLEDFTALQDYVKRLHK